MVYVWMYNAGLGTYHEFPAESGPYWLTRGWAYSDAPDPLPSETPDSLLTSLASAIVQVEADRAEVATNKAAVAGVVATTDGLMTAVANDSTSTFAAQQLASQVQALLPVKTKTASALSLASPGTAALVRKLRAGVDSARATVLGDSTANEPGEWFELTMSRLLAAFPIYTGMKRLWDDATQKPGAWTTTQTGVGGARNLYCTLSNGAYISTPDAPINSVTGDLGVALKVAVDDWTPATAMDLCGKSGSIPQAGWFLRLNTAGTLTLFWSTDGSAVPTATSTVSVPFADGTIGYLRASLDVDNGASGRDIKFFTSTDGTTWNQLGATITQAGVTSIYDNTATLNFPGRSAASLGGLGFGGLAAYWMRVYSDITFTTVVADCDVTFLINNNTGFTDAAGNTWTPASSAVGAAGELRGAPILFIDNMSTPGMAISYSNDATRFAKQTAQPWMDVAFINYGHNEGTITGTYRAAYKQLADAMLAKWPDCAIVAVPQNQQTAPRTAGQIAAHASRGAVIRALAASRGWALLDAFDAIARKGPGAVATYVNPADGVHPLPAGSVLIADEADGLFPV